MKKVLVYLVDLVGCKEFLKVNVVKLKRLLSFVWQNVFNDEVRRQRKNHQLIPIIIISFNQLFYLKRLIDFLYSKDYKNIVVIDNNSTYKPLLQYFDAVEGKIKIHRLKQNHGHLVFWKVEELFEKYSKGYYVVTDPDINPIPECPEDFLQYFKKILDKDFGITKVGFSLKIDDIPFTNRNKERILKWETQFWNNKRNDGNFSADIDTTFALYRARYKYTDSDFYNAVRTKKPYLAIHGGWYIDNENLTEEQKYFFTHCNTSSTWRINEEGKISRSIYL